MDNKTELNHRANQVEIKIQELLIRPDNEKLLALNEELLQIYTDLGFKFQVSKVMYEIEKYRKKIATSKVTHNISPNESNAHHEAVPTFSHIDSQQPSYQRDLPKTLSPKATADPTASLNSKVEGAKKSRMEVFEAKKEGTSLNSYQTTMQDRRKKILEARALREKEEISIDEANAFLDQAKTLLDKKKFEEAATLYEKAGDIFKEIGWTQQSKVIYDEVENCNALKIEYEGKIKAQQDLRDKQAEAYEARAANIIAEKDRLQKLKEEQDRELSPELKEKAKMALMIQEKAELLLKKGKTEKAIVRFEYLAEIYAEIGFQDRVEAIKTKIVELQKQK